MDSIVLELQREALDPKCSTSDLLRRALVVAKKLKLAEFDRWISNELNGYPGPVGEIPAYRNLKGEAVALNPFHGPQPIEFESEEHHELVSHRWCGQSVAALNDLLRGKAAGATMQISMSTETQNELRRVLGPELPRVVLQISPSSIAGILDTVRTTVLNWALQLEEDGILGEGLSFSPQEKARASESGYHVFNFHAPVSNSQFAQGAQNPVQIVVSPAVNIDEVKAILADVKAAAANADLGTEEARELDAEIATVESQTMSPKPKAPVIRQTLASIRTILEGAAGGALAAQVPGLIERIARLLSG